MTECEHNGSGYIFGLAGNSVLERQVAEAADHLRFWHAFTSEPKLRCYKALEYKAKSWSRARRVVAHRGLAAARPDAL